MILETDEILKSLMDSLKTEIERLEQESSGQSKLERNYLVCGVLWSLQEVCYDMLRKMGKN